MHKTWIQKKKLEKNVSNSKIDNLYKEGLKNGASGGKLLGAGAGGFMLFYVPKINQKKFIKKYKELIINFSFTYEGNKIFKIN